MLLSAPVLPPVTSWGWIKSEQGVYNHTGQACFKQPTPALNYFHANAKSVAWSAAMAKKLHLPSLPCAVQWKVHTELLKLITHNYGNLLLWDVLDIANYEACENSWIHHSFCPELKGRCYHFCSKSIQFNPSLIMSIMDSWQQHSFKDCMCGEVTTVGIIRNSMIGSVRAFLCFVNNEIKVKTK